jgi:hypothetical protein
MPGLVGDGDETTAAKEVGWDPGPLGLMGEMTGR